MAVSFHLMPPIQFRLSDRAKLKRWIKTIVENHHKSLGETSFILCSDEYLYQINMEYLQHNTYTDIITFDNSDNPGIIEGDIFISIERVVDNAKKYGVSPDEELRRVVAHGILHLLGFKDKKTEEQALMRQKEEECLLLFKSLL
ncbi:MAG: rRNA maturation RNase YbeY [Sphingobacteriales bacterium]|nr:MAG: rRNA maturation RNase YbeY [Sphingobacteriales bacterium]